VNRIVLDASALLAILHQEPGAEIFAQRFDLLENASMSAVNVAEAMENWLGWVLMRKMHWEAVISPVPEIVDFDREQANCGLVAAPNSRRGIIVGRPRMLGSRNGPQSASLHSGSDLEKSAAESFDSRYSIRRQAHDYKEGVN
jgi:PIN domain nuclease of toxin-antitoxin system